jgi:hypothetical protein
VLVLETCLRRMELADRISTSIRGWSGWRELFVAILRMTRYKYRDTVKFEE